MFRILLAALGLLLGSGPALAHKAGEPAPPGAAPWGANYFPEASLITHEGKRVRFYEDLMKDKMVLVNFVFTGCSQSCPLDTAKMAQVRKQLGDRVGRDIFLYSITLDPLNDTPEVLRAYAAKFGVGPGWQFLTGNPDDIDKVRHKLGDRGAKEEHSNTVRIGDVNKGRWIRVPLAADAKYIAMEAINTLDPGWSAGRNLPSIADAKRVEIFGPGQLLFNNRCAACHTFGKGDQIGPDLRGVTTRRERDWLVRYLAEPDKVRARGDPVALQLAQQYKVPMPNLGLTRKELDDVLAYVVVKSSEAPVTRSASAQAATPVDGGDDHRRLHASPAAHK